MGRSEGRSVAPASLSDFVRWLEIAPPSTTIAAADLVVILEPFTAERATSTAASPTDSPAAPWRERLWSVPLETRLGVREAAEALGRPVSFVYRHTSEKSGAGARLPHRKLDGELLFIVGELRSWIREHEEIIASGPADTPTLSLTTRRAV